MKRLAWMTAQLAIMAVWVWNGVTMDPPIGGLALGGGAVLLAFVATIIPLALIEGAKDIRRLYLPALRRRRATGAAPQRDPGQPVDRLHGPRRIGLTRQPTK